MNLKIEIDCETFDELMTHLTVIRQSIRREFKRQGDNILSDGSAVADFELSDDNCYGEHTIILENHD